MKNKISLVFSMLLFSIFTFSQNVNNVELEELAGRPGGGGLGASGPGGASPIDMYVLALVVIAALGVLLYSKKYKAELK